MRFSAARRAAAGRPGRADGGGRTRGQSRYEIQITRIARTIARTSAYAKEPAIAGDCSAITGMVVTQISSNSGARGERPSAIEYRARNTTTAATPNRIGGVGSNAVDSTSAVSADAATIAINPTATLSGGRTGTLTSNTAVSTGARNVGDPLHQLADNESEGYAECEAQRGVRPRGIRTSQ